MITSELLSQSITVEKYQVIHFILLGPCEERFMVNVVVYE